MTLQSLLVLSASLLLCSGARLPRQLSLEDKMKRLPDLNTCGLTDAGPRSRIIGGEPAQLKEIPWMAALGYVSNNETDVKWLCGGSLITNQHVLTAAYCVHPDEIRSKKLTTIRLGELDLNEKINDGSQPQDIAVDSVIMHEQYDSEKKTNIIAIIKMKTKVTFSTVDSHLTIGSVEIHDIDECRRNLTRHNDKVIIDSRVICASSPVVDACQGFGGGPLMLPRIQQQSYPKMNYFLMGIISHGLCGVEGYPGVYTNVSSYSNWIIEHLDI